MIAEMMEVESGDSGAGMQALRAVRLLRALQLARLLHKQKALKVVLNGQQVGWGKRVHFLGVEPPWLANI